MAKIEGFRIKNFRMLKDVWVLEKGEDGFSTIHRASEDATVTAMVDEGLPLGSLWYSDYLDAR